MKANAAFDMMEKILPYMSAIVNDEEGKNIVEMWKNGKEIKGGDFMRKVIPFFTAKHRDDTYGMVAAITGKDIAEVQDMEMEDLLSALRSGFDTNMLDFFGCCLRVVRVL